MSAIPRDFFLAAGAPTAPRVDGLRIALFTSTYNHIVDGVSLTLNRLVDFLEEQGARVKVYSPTTDTPQISHAGTLVPVRGVRMPGRKEYMIAVGLNRSQVQDLEAFDPHLVHITSPDPLGLQAARWAHRTGIPVVASYHTNFTSYLEYYRIGWTEPVVWTGLRFFYGRADRVFVPTPAIASLLAEHRITNGIRLWPRGVETDRFNPARRDTGWRRSVGIDDRDVVVTFVSRVVAEKGIDVFADTLEHLTAMGVPHRALVVGDGPARGDLQKRIPGGLFTGTLRDDELARAYASSDIFLFPSATETFGNVTLEAMASGLPTVCADAPGSDALVRAGRTGYLVPPGDARAFADRVATLALDRSLRKRMGTQARTEAERYAWPVVLDRILGYYVELLHPSRSVPTPQRAPSSRRSLPQGQPVSTVA